MSLDAGNMPSAVAPVFESTYTSVPTVYGPWNDWEPSRVSHHGKVCCEMAREWIVGTDFSALNGAHPLTGPRWLRHRFEWGPGTYPIYWCGLVKKTKLDCGVLAALAHEVFSSRGVRCFRAQLVQTFSDSASATWRAGWETDNAITAWIEGADIYHEGVAVVGRNGELKLWDSSAGWWIDPKTTSGYGALLAVRISGSHDTEFRWGDHRIPAGVWNRLSN